MTARRLRVGITTMAVDPPDRFREIVALVEAGGFDELWVCDSSLHARDVYVALTLAATGTRRIRFGPNCTHPSTRHPAITANAMATLQELSGGRALLALGVGDRPVMELGGRMAPVETVREMIRVVRGLHAGETLDAAGPIALRQARLAVAPPAAVPVYLSASGPRMLELGAGCADGVLFLSGVHPPCLDYALAHLRAGAVRAGRSLAAFDVGCTVAGSLRSDLAQARRECVPMAAWFPQSARPYAELAGVPAATVERIRAAYAGGHFDAAREAFRHVTDEMVDRFTIAGPAEVWVGRLGEIVARGVEHLNIFLMSGDRLAMVRDLADKVLPRLGRAR